MERNQQVVVVLQERGGECSLTREREREQPAESRLPLKGMYLHSQHTSANDKCRRSRGALLTGCPCAGRMDRWRERQPMTVEEEKPTGGRRGGEPVWMCFTAGEKARTSTKDIQSASLHRPATNKQRFILNLHFGFKGAIN